MILDEHREINLIKEGKEGGMKPIGTTKKGIGPAYMEKANRSGVRVCDLLEPEEFERKLSHCVSLAHQRTKFDFDVKKEVQRYLNEYLPRIAEMIVDGQFWLDEQYKAGKKILFEGANAAMLDIDFGTYPYVTSSSPTIGGCATGSSLAPNKFSDGKEISLPVFVRLFLKNIFYVCPACSSTLQNNSDWSRQGLHNPSRRRPFSY